MARKLNRLFALAFSLAVMVPMPGRAVANRTIVLVGANKSINWGGYNQGALDHALYHRVTGDWTVPTATQHQSGRAEYSSAWIGIGGGCAKDNCSVNDNTLIQTGTEQDVSKSGAASYDAWFELIPGPSLS